jgi:hypothetical protein
MMDMSVLLDDPYLQAFDRLPASQQLNEQRVAALLDLSVNTLQNWRAAGHTPPVWVKVSDKLVRYPVGPLRDWLNGMAAATPSVEPSRPVRPDPRGRLSVQERASLQLPILTRGRRAKQATVTSFLASGSHTDEWLFELSSPYSRPIDFIAAMELDLPDGGECVWLTLSQYAAHLRKAVEHEAAEAVSRALEDELPAAPPGQQTGGLRDR